MKSRLMLICTNVVALGSMYATWATAQQANTTTSGSEASTSSLQEIIVTAQKREENSQRVPISIEVDTAEQLAAAGVESTEDLAAITPSVTYQSQLGYFMPRIRGVGSTGDGPGIESPVSVYVDGIYIAAMPAALVSFVDIDRVETLKGPQGTLFGRNATGGLINVITKDPQQQFSGDASVEAANYDSQSVGAYITGGLADNLAGDFGIQWSRQGQGYGRNIYDGTQTDRINDEIAMRTKLLFAPGDETKIRLSLDFSDSNGSAPSVRDFPGEIPLLGGAQPSNPWDTNTNVDFSASEKSGGVGLRIDQDLGAVKLVNLTGFRESDHDLVFNYTVSPTPGLAVAFDNKDRQLSEELQLLSNTKESIIQWTVGIYYFNAGSEANPNGLIFGGPFLLPSSPFYPLTATNGPGEQTTNSYAGFGQATAALTATTHLTLGVRYTDEKRGLTGRDYGQIGGVSVPTAPPVDVSTWFDKVTYRAALDQQITPDVLAYVSVNTGFKSGGYSETILTFPPYKPETITAYEVGVKSEMFDRRLRVNTAAFYYDYKDIQVGVLTQGNIGITNGPQATIYGLDLDADSAITSAFNVTAGLSLLHARFGDYPDAVFNSPLPTGGNVTTVGNATDNTLPYSPDWQVRIAPEYRIPLPSGGLVLNGTYFHNSGFYTEVDNLRAQPAYNLFNASMAWKDSSDRFTLMLWGKNLGNKGVLQEGTASGFGTLTAFQPPRTFGATFRVHF